MRYALKPSGTYLLLLIIAHLLAMGSVCLANLPIWARLSLVLIISFSLFNNLYVHLRAKCSWRSFTLEKNYVLVNTLGGDTLSGELSRQTVVTPLCVVLCAKFGRTHHCQVIFFDAMQVDSFRGLRVRLKFS